jgi:prepilin-type N-terminal cleavage/methylation domain-containing protein
VEIRVCLSSVNEKFGKRNPSIHFKNKGGTKMLTKRNQKGFTLIEIIAVLVILGILAAVAVPKYMNLQVEAKNKAAVAQVAEIKGVLSSAWGKAALKEGGNPSAANVEINSGLSATGGNMGTAPDIWYYTLTRTANVFAIAVTGRGTDTEYNNAGSWTMPQ